MLVHSRSLHGCVADVCFHVLSSWITSIVVTESELGSTIYAGNAMGDVSVLERSADGASMSLAPATEPWPQPSIADSTQVLPAASTAYPGSAKSQSRSRSKVFPCLNTCYCHAGAITPVPCVVFVFVLCSCRLEQSLITFVHTRVCIACLFTH